MGFVDVFSVYGLLPILGGLGTWGVARPWRFQNEVLGRVAALCRIGVRDLQVSAFLSLSDLEIAGQQCFGLLVPLGPGLVETVDGRRGTILVLDARRLGSGVRVSFCARPESTVAQLAEILDLPRDIGAAICWEEIAQSQDGPWNCCLVRVQDCRNFPASKVHNDYASVGAEDRTGHVFTCPIRHAHGRDTTGDQEQSEESSSAGELEEEVSTSDDPGQTVSFAVMSLNRVAQQVQVSLSFPCTEQAAIEAVAQALDEDFFRLFPSLIAAQQQPSTAWGLLVAMPSWAVEDPVGLLDMRQVDGRLFVAALPPTLSKARVLAVACPQNEQEVDVYPFGRETPLDEEEEIPLLVLGMIVIVPAGEMPPSVGNLPHMPTSRIGWDDDIDMFSSTPWQQAGQLCAVLDTGCKAFTLMPGRAHCHNLDVSIVFNIPLCWTTIQVTRPPIRDVELDGRTCKGVALVSDQIANVPMPPRRAGPHKFLIAIDCRPILCAIDQWLVVDMRCPHEELAQHYDTFAPEGHQVQIEGAEIRNGNLIVTPGLVLTVHFVPCTPMSWEPEGAEVPESGPRLIPAEDSTSSHEEVSRSVGTLSGVGGISISNSSVDDRSRSPRRTTFGDAVSAVEKGNRCTLADAPWNNACLIGWYGAVLCSRAVCMLAYAQVEIAMCCIRICLASAALAARPSRCLRVTAPISLVPHRL